MFEIYKNKKVFLTGHTGFKGSWLSLWLTSLGAEVCGYSLEPNSYPSMFKALDIENKISKSVIGNILNAEKLEKTMYDFKPDIVFHLAAQPIVRLSYKEPVLTYQTNVIGSLNVLESSRKLNCPIVNITTDKCYENKEQNIKYKETDALGGYDMYSSSKACVEIMTSSYRRSFDFDVVTARAGNVIGGGDWADDRLVPDCVRCIEQDKQIELRNPDSIRPWQFVLEPLCGYLMLGEKLIARHCEERSDEAIFSFNFGPDEAFKVGDVANKIVKSYGKGQIKVNKSDDLHEANLLMLDAQKAKDVLGWKQVYDIDKSIEKTVEWYKYFYKKDIDMFEFTLSQIREYEEEWKKS